jgi:hypothetical protein
MRLIPIVVLLLGFVVYLIAQICIRTFGFLVHSAKGDFAEAAAALLHRADSPAQTVVLLLKRQLISKGLLLSEHHPLEAGQLPVTVAGYAFEMTTLLAAKQHFVEKDALREVRALCVGLFGVKSAVMYESLAVFAINGDVDFEEGRRVARQDFEERYLSRRPLSRLAGLFNVE